MSSIHNIPEPTTAYRPVVDEPTPAPPPPLGAAATRRPDCAERTDTSRPDTEIDEEVGGLTWLIVLLLSGVLSRLALWFFGPWQGAAEGATRWAELGHLLIDSGPRAIEGAMPVIPLLALGLETLGVPLSILSGFQALLGVVAIAAGYHLGRQLTGRCLAGVGVAALLALHPGVLTWATAVSPGGLACGLVVIGLYLLVRPEKEGVSTPWSGAIVLGLAALTSPAAWLVGPGAALWRLTQERGRRGVVSACIVLACTLGPAIAWSSASGASIAPRWSSTNTTSQTTAPGIMALTSPSLEALGTQLRFTMQPHGALAQASHGRANAPAQRDPVADVLGESWVALNTAMLLACCVGLGLMLLRGRIAAVALTAMPVLGLLATGLPLNEPGRIALLGPLALLAFGWLSAPAQPALTPEEKEAKLQEKELKHQQKLEQRRLKHEAKHGLYVFDKQKKAAQSAQSAVAVAATTTQATASPSPESLPAPAPEDPPPPAMMRPI